MQSYNFYYYLFLVFLFFVYLILTDKSVAKYIFLLSKIVKIEIQKNIWVIKNNPNNPIVKYFLYRKSLKNAREIINEINKNKDLKEL